MKLFTGILVSLLILSGCAALRGYSDEESQNIDKVTVYGNEAEMHTAAKSVSDNPNCEFIGIMTGTSGYGSYTNNNLSGIKGTYSDALFYARLMSLRNKANAFVVKNAIPSKVLFESPNDYIYTLTGSAYRCTGYPKKTNAD